MPKLSGAPECPFVIGRLQASRSTELRIPSGFTGGRLLQPCLLKPTWLSLRPANPTRRSPFEVARIAHRNRRADPGVQAAAGYKRCLNQRTGLIPVRDTHASGSISERYERRQVSRNRGTGLDSACLSSEERISITTLGTWVITWPRRSGRTDKQVHHPVPRTLKDLRPPFQNGLDAILLLERYEVRSLEWNRSLHCGQASDALEGGH